MKSCSMKHRVVVSAASLAMLLGSSISIFAGTASAQAADTGAQQQIVQGPGGKVFGCINEPARIMIVTEGIPPTKKTALVPAHTACGKVF